MTLQLLHSEFPYIWGKFDFLFYQCTTDPSLQNNADPSPFSLPGWKTVDQHFACSNNLYAFSDYTLLFLLPHAPCTLAKCYRMRRIRLQFATVRAVYASKLLPHAPHTLAKNSFLLDFANVCAVCASNLLPYAPHTLATCYRMRRIR